MWKVSKSIYIKDILIYNTIYYVELIDVIFNIPGIVYLFYYIGGEFDQTVLLNADPNDAANTDLSFVRYNNA